MWAIGTGLVCPPERAQNVHSEVRYRVLTSLYGTTAAEEAVIQYGGSVTATNARELLSMPDIDGCLVGGASLKAASFTSIIAAIASH